MMAGSPRLARTHYVRHGLHSSSARVYSSRGCRAATLLDTAKMAPGVKPSHSGSGRVAPNSRRQTLAIGSSFG